MRVRSVKGRSALELVVGHVMPDACVRGVPTNLDFGHFLLLDMCRCNVKSAIFIVAGAISNVENAISVLARL